MTTQRPPSSFNEAMAQLFPLSQLQTAQAQPTRHACRWWERHRWGLWSERGRGHRRWVDESNEVREMVVDVQERTCQRCGFIQRRVL